MKKSYYIFCIVCIFLIGACSACSNASEPESSGSGEGVAGYDENTDSNSATEPETTEETVTLYTPNIADDNYRNYYEIFVYSFSDSNGDGIGDLNGVTEKLDYIADMGFNGIWLTPIMPSTTYHKYDVTDYMAIDEEFGTIDDFKNLMKEAFDRDIKVIIDLPINHTSSQHPWFKEACAYLQGLDADAEPDVEECPYVAYYHFSREQESSSWYKVAGVDWYYEGSFWSEMPDLDLSCEALRSEFEEVAEFWINQMVIDGFRMDAPLHYEESDTAFNTEVLNWFYNVCKAYDPTVYMVSEVWANEAVIADYYTSETPSMFNFDAAQAEGKLIKAARGKYSAEKLAAAMVQYEKDFGSNYADYIDAPFLTNHDMPRVSNALNNSEENLKRACALLMMMRGSTYVYYGEEIGMASSGTKDENKRLPMIWTDATGAANGGEISGTGTAAEECGMTVGPADADGGITSKFGSVEQQLEDPDSILNFYKTALSLRNAYPAIARGDTTIIDELTSDDIAVIRRSWEGDDTSWSDSTAYDPSTVYIVINTGDSDEVTEVNLTGTVSVGTAGDAVSMDKLTLGGFLSVSEDVTLEDGILRIPGGAVVVLE